MAEMNAETAAALREAFPPAEIGKLPRVTCGACREKSCREHQRTRCQTCRNYIPTAHIHLDYVGHAEVTDRLLSVDPDWSWEPVAWDPHGLPAFDALGGLWVRLHVAGVARLGYGHADGKRGGDAVKECIGDALRNAAMRFGVGLDLWRRTESPAEDAEPTVDTTEEPESAPAVRARIAAEAQRQDMSLEAVSASYQNVMGHRIQDADTSALNRYLAELQADAA